MKNNHNLDKCVSKVNDALHISLYPEQISAVKYLLNGNFCEVATGEGKTYTLLLLSYYLVKYSSKRVVVLSSSKDLCLRDSVIYAKVFGSESISVDILNCAEVTFTISSELAFAYLNSKIEPEEYVVLVDELDYVAVDCSNSSFGAGTEGVKDIYALKFVNRFNLFMQDISVQTYYCKEDDLFKSISFNSGNDVNINLTSESYLAEQSFYDKFYRFFGEGKEDDIYHSMLESFIKAKYFLKEERDYLCIEDRVHMIDPSGYISLNATYDGITQTFLEIKYNIYRLNSISKNYFIYLNTVLKKFNDIYGVSGTLLEVQDELEVIFSKKTKVVPRHFKLQLTDYNEKRFTTTLAKCVFINSITCFMEHVLILCSSDYELNKLISNGLIYDASFNSLSVNLSEDCHNSRIIVATIVAGRGLNIKSDNLKVIIADTIFDGRIIRQFKGRTSRNGSGGEIYLITSDEDLENMQIPKEIHANLRNLKEYVNNKLAIAEVNRLNNLCICQIIDRCRVHLQQNSEFTKNISLHDFESIFYDLSQYIRTTFYNYKLNYKSIGTNSESGEFYKRVFKEIEIIKNNLG